MNHQQVALQKPKLAFAGYQSSPWILGMALAIAANDFLSRTLLPSVAQTIPMIVFFALAYLLFRYTEVLNLLKSRSALGWLLIYGIVVALLRYYLFYIPEQLTISPIARQSSAFFLGTLVYLALTHLFSEKTDSLGTKVLLVSVPLLIFGVIQRATGWLTPFFPRVQSFFSEPSYYGDYLVLMVAPFFFKACFGLRRMSSRQRIAIFGFGCLFMVNMLFVESGTALLKLVTFLICFLCFYPMHLKLRIAVLGFGAIAFLGTIFLFGGYVLKVWSFATDILGNPDMFFRYHTFYDRLYPIWPALRNLFSFKAFLGLGFGGDFYEFKSLFPPSTHLEMIATKPSLSYFNSFASKIILYFGIFGFFWYISLFRSALRTKDHLFRIGLLNVLITSLWGVSNFALPYLWFWLALSHSKDPADD